MLTADRTRTQDASARRQEAAAAKAAKPSLLEPGLVESWLAGRGHSAFRGKQIRRRIFRDRLDDASRWTELPERLRAEIVAELRIFPFDVEEHRVASDGTEKLLLRLDDGHLVETVLMREQGRRTVCVSTQVGCAMGCVFCASGLLGVTRSLTAAEILGQVLAADRLLGDGERITNVVVMGIGEPLANLKNLVPVLRAMTDHHGCAIGARKITVSTIGLPKKIEGR
ncbi:MAG: 23S rRNA (adenine(2503)-C(2))-methyltransferase RlmN, partial [Planctomycetota bacterium]